MTILGEDFLPQKFGSGMNTDINDAILKGIEMGLAYEMGPIDHGKNVKIVIMDIKDKDFKKHVAYVSKMSFHEFKTLALNGNMFQWMTEELLEARRAIVVPGRKEFGSVVKIPKGVGNGLHKTRC